MAKEATVACEPFSLEKGMQYLNHFSSCSQKSCDYSLVNLWAWDEYFGYHWAWDGDLVWLPCTRPYEAFQAPVGRWETQDWREIFERFPEGTCFERVPERLACIWKRALGDREVVTMGAVGVSTVKDLVKLRKHYHRKEKPPSAVYEKLRLDLQPLRRSSHTRGLEDAARVARKPRC